MVMMIIMLSNNNNNNNDKNTVFLHLINQVYNSTVY